MIAHRCCFGVILSVFLLAIHIYLTRLIKGVKDNYKAVRKVESRLYVQLLLLLVALISLI